MKTFVVTIDGPAGCGKSTVSKLVADKIGASFLDTGAMYRAVTFLAKQAGFDLEDSMVISAMMDNANFEFKPDGDKMVVLARGLDISDHIRSPEITENVHYIANNPDLREKLVEMQQDFASQHKKIVTEGRDQGTVAFPDADIKFFLTASVDCRTDRRVKQLAEDGVEVDRKKIFDAIEMRDARDYARQFGPLVEADDAITIDTTNLNIEQAVEKLLCHIKQIADSKTS